MAIVLGIESTAHTFGVAVVQNGKILSNVRDAYTTQKGGIIPMEAAKHHEAIKKELYEEALVDANVKEKDIELIAFSQGPGLAPCLLEGLRFTKQKSKELNVPVVPVNHCVAHLEIGKITGAKDPVLLYASGANTQIIAYAAGKYRVFGETLDIGIGNFIDTFAREAGMGFPGGPRIQELAEKAKQQEKGAKYIELPYSVKGMDIALSGLLTNLKQKLIKLNKTMNINYTLEDLAFSLQETAFAMLVEVSERALAHVGKKELLLGGGVACNTRLQEMCKIMCEERGAKFYVPENSLLVDNAAMIAYTGEIMFNKGIKVSSKEIEKLDILPRQRTDDVIVSWK